MRKIFQASLVLANALLVPGLYLAAQTMPAETRTDAPFGALTPAEAARDIALARDVLETLHPGYTRYTPADTLDKMWAALETKAATGLDRGALYLEISRILAAIRCDHTKAELPADLEVARQTQPVFLPFRFKLFSNRMYIDQAAPGSGLTRGAEVLTIDGYPISVWLDEIAPLIPVDGDTDYVKSQTLAATSEFMGSGFDHFAEFIRPIGNRVTLKVEDPSGSMRIMTTERLTFPEFEAITGERRFGRNFADAIRFDRLGVDGAYLAIDTFVNYRKPVDPMATLGPIFATLASENRDKLILDLRRNSGGSNDAQTALLRHLIASPTRQVEAILTRYTQIPPRFKAHLETWDQRALQPDPDMFEALGDGTYRLTPEALNGEDEPVSPAPQAFAGDVILLTGPENASGVTHLLATLALNTNALRAGAPTGGAPTGATANIIFFLELPASGIRVRVPAQRTQIAGSAELPGRTGLSPHIEAPSTRATYFAGDDPALAAAKAHFGLN